MTVIGDAFVAIKPSSGGFVKNLESQLSGVSLAGPGAVIGATLAIGLVTGLAKIGQMFGSAKVQITRETGQLGADLDATFSTVKRVMNDVPDSIGNVTTAVDELVRRGVPLGATFDKLAKQELELARLTKSDLATTVETTTALFTKFNVPLREQPAALDAIFKGYQASGKGLADLTGSLQTGGAALVQFGFDIFSSTALIAGLERAGVNVGPALAGLRKAFATIAKEGGDPKKVLHDLLNEFTDGTPKAKAMSDAMKLFGTRAGTELAAAIQSGKFDVKDLLKIITNGKGGILDTAAATRTFGENLDIMKNRALVALQPLGSAVWKEIRGTILDGVAPVEAFALGFAHLAKELAPLGAAIAVLIFVGLKALLGAIGLVATGLEGVASFLSHFPAPVLIAAAAVAILVKAFFSLRALGGIQALFVSIAEGVTGAIGPLTIIVGVLAVVGIAMTLFGGHTSAAVKEAKDLAAALFATAGSGTFFAEGIGSAATGLADFLAKQDQAGKLKNLDAALSGTSFTLRDVSKAVAGTSQDFESFKQSIADQLGIPQTARAFAEMSVAQQSAAVSAGKVNGVTIDQANIFSKVTSALDQQRDAFVRASEGELQASFRAGDLTASQLKQAEAIAHATVGERGYGAALDFASEAIAENVRKTDAQKIATAAFAPKLAELKQQIIDGTIGTNDAADAAAKWGIQLETTKGIIADTQAALKQFVSQGLAGLPDSSSAVDDWAKGVETAFTAVAASAGKPAKEVAKAKADLLRALDPAQIVAKVQEQAAQIARFQTNLLALVARFPHAVQALLANPNKQAAAQFAQSLVDKPAIAAAFEGAQTTIDTKTQEITTQLKGPLAQRFLAGGAALGAAVTTGVTSTTHLQPPVDAQTTAALAALQKQEAFARAGGDLGAAATFSMQQKMILENVARSQSSGAATAITAGSKPVADAAGAAGASATSAFAGALPLGAKTTAAIDDSKTSWNGQTTIFVAGEARRAGIVIGAQFDKGIAQGIRDNQSDITRDAAAAGNAAAAATRTALKQKSPSLVGIDIGENFVRGIAIGLSHTAPVSSAAGQIAAVLVGDFATFSSTALGVLPNVGTDIQNFTAGVHQAVATLKTDTHAAGSDVARLAHDWETATAKVAAANKVLSTHQANLRGTLVLAQQKLFTDVTHGAPTAQIFKDQDAVNKAQGALVKQLLIDTAKLNELRAAGHKILTDDKTALAAAQALVAHDRGVLAQASDASAFTRSVTSSALLTQQFQANVSKLVKEGFPQLAQQLAQLGPDAASELAAGFASDSSKAKAANAALSTATVVSDTYKKWLSDTFGPLFGDAGAQAGEALGTSAQQAIARSLGTTVQQIIDIQAQLKASAGPTSALSVLSGRVSPTDAAARSVSTASAAKMLTFELTLVDKDGNVTGVKKVTVPVSESKAKAKALMTARGRA